MPSGYTADLYDGEQSFEEFVLRCARGMGALITMRDEPFDAPIPDHFTPEVSYHETAISTARSRLAEALSWSEEEAENAAREEYEQAFQAWVEHKRKAEERVARYQQMLDQVEAWEPPTPDHVSFKQFMIDQLNASIKHDGWTYEAPRLQAGYEFQQSVIERARRDINYHSKEMADELARAEGRTAWVRALKESLGGVRSG